MYDPRPTPANTITIDAARFTLLSDRLIRLEWSEDGVFEDRATLTACHRRTKRVGFTAEETADGWVIDTGALQLRYRPNGKPLSKRNCTVTFQVDRQTATWHPGKKDRANLGGTHRTLDGFNGDMKEVWNHETHQREGWRTVPMSPGLISRSGWAVVDDSGAPVLDAGAGDQVWVQGRSEGARQDIYLLAYGLDYKDALADAAQVFGHQPMIPRYALGYWYSRYFAYMDRDIEDLVEQFDRFDVPLDVMVIDMDWHLVGWTGYTWDDNYFPDAPATLAWLHNRGVKTSLNLHPADGVAEFEAAFPAVKKMLGRKKVAELKAKHGLTQTFKNQYLHLFADNEADFDYVPFDITDQAYMEAYFKLLHRPHEKDGVDVWWMDWQQGETTAIANLDTLPWINHLHWEDQERNPDKADQRPICFSRYGGVGAGRYPIGFSGDTHITWESLAYQPWFTATASNVLYGTWSHDIGGHMAGNNTPELYTRWMQFGIYSPILRTHASKDNASDRRVFAYPEPYNDLMMDLIRLRYEMVPYIYGAMRQAHDAGISMVRPMYYEHPRQDEAYKAKNQYYFGDDLIVAPVCEPLADKDQQAPVSVWLPQGTWYDTAHGRLLKGGHHTGRYRLDEVPVFARAGAVIPGQQTTRRLEPGSYRDLVFTCYPGADGVGTLYEDDGISLGYSRGESASITVRQRSEGRRHTITLGKMRGTYADCIDERSLELRLPGSIAPEQVRIGRHQVSFAVDLNQAGDAAWAYDGDTATTIIRLHSIDVRQGLTCTITRQQGVSRKQLDGLSGLLRRLVSIGREVAQQSYWRAYFLDERFSVRVAQTGNRIGRDPSQLAKELRGLRQNLAALPDHLEAYAKATMRRKEDLSAKAATFRRIRKQVLAVIKQFDRG